MSIFERIKKVFKSSDVQQLESTSKKHKIHDYTSLFWGHNIFLDDFKGTDSQGKAYQDSFRCSGIGPIFGRLDNHDYIAVKMQSGYVGIFEIFDISYCRDPHDQWFANARWIGYPNRGSEHVVRIHEFAQWLREYQNS